VDRNMITTLVDGIFSKALQARRMLERDATEMISLPLAELAILGRKLEPMIAPEALERAAASLAQQRWQVPTVELSRREGYAKWAGDYDDEVNPLIAMEEPATLEALGDVAGKDVLDAACGTGRYAIRLAQAGARVCGVDASEAMLAVARRKRDELGLVADLGKGELTSLPFADESFDVAVCALTFCHLPDLRPATAELARVLRPGGRLVISDFHPFCLLIGWRTCLRRPEATYMVENYLHLVQDYVAALLDSGFTLTGVREEVVDERLGAIMSGEAIERFRGWPGALIIAARREQTTETEDA